MFSAPSSRLHKFLPGNPARVITVSFLFVILMGPALLVLPISSRGGTATPFDEALFTATSATCVTGLIVHDTYLYWSPFGQAVMLALILVGGLGVVSFASFFYLALGR